MHATAQEPTLMHIKQVARQLGVHESTVRRHIHAGDLEAVRLGEHGRYRVSLAALDEFLRPATPREATR